MIVGLLEQAFFRDIVDIVFMRRVARGMSARRPDFDHQNGLGRLVLRQNIANISRIGTGAASASRIAVGSIKPDRQLTRCRALRPRRVPTPFWSHGKP